MIRGDFSQDVFIAGVRVFTTGMSITESSEGIIPRLSFRLHSEVNPGLEQFLALSAEVSVTQSDGTRSITYLGQINTIKSSRVVDADAFDIEVLGEADKLARQRFTESFPAELGASELVTAIMAKFSGSAGIEYLSGIDSNQQVMGGLMMREETILEAFNKISRRTGWIFQVREGKLLFFDPLTQPAAFDIASAKTMERSTLSISEDLSGVHNIVRSEAFQYRDIVITKRVSGCTQTIYGPRFGAEFEVAEQPIITEPEELEGAAGEINLFNGAVSFSQPLQLAGDGDPNKQNFSVTVKYRIRRKLLAERRDLSSIALYGERVGVFTAGNGGDDIDTVLKKLAADLDRKAFPIITGSVRVVEIGLRPGMVVPILPLGSINPRSVVIQSVATSASGGDAQVTINFSSRSYFFAEPQLDMLERIENLEKADLHTGSVTGKVIREVNPVSANPSVAVEVLRIASTVTVIVAAIADFTGGGSFAFKANAINAFLGRFSGGGAFAFDPTEFPVSQLVVTGGGNLIFTGSKISGPIVDLSVTGGGKLLYTGSKISGPIVDLSATGGGRFVFIAEKVQGVRINKNTIVV